MSTAGILANAYIDVNILLAVALVVWLALKQALTALGVSAPPSLWLNLLRLGILAALLAPLALSLLAQTALWPAGGLLSSVSLTDYVIAQYLQGRLGLGPSEVEALVTLRQRLGSSLGSADAGPGAVVAVALGLGFVALGGRFLRGVLALRRVLAQCHRWRRSGRLHLLFSDSVAVPFATRSLGRKYIVLPSAMLCDRRDLAFAVAHEGRHLRNGDVEWEVLFEGLTPLLFWNPAFLIWKAQARRLRELVCDRSVLARRPAAVRDYCEFLLRVGGRGVRAARPAFPAAALAPVGRGVLGRRTGLTLRQRVVALLDPCEPRQRRSLSLCCGCLLAAAVLLSAVWVRQPATVSTERLHLATIVILERMTENRPERGYNLVMGY